MKIVKIDSILVPYKVEDMKMLISWNIALTKFSLSYLPTLKKIAKSYKENIEIVPFELIEDNMVKKLFSYWTSFDNNKAKKVNSRISLYGDKNNKNINRLRDIEIKLKYFFERWGFAFEFVSTGTGNRCGLRIDYSLSKYKYPVIKCDSLESDPCFDPAILELGNIKIVLSPRADGYTVTVYHKTFMADWEAVLEENMDFNTINNSHFIETLFTLLNKKALEKGK